MNRPLQLIVACDQHRVIGHGRRLPFHIPEDKAWFHEKTAGTTVVLGRVCFEIWPRVLLDGRAAVVLASQPAAVRADAERRFGPAARDRLHVVADVPAALAAARALPAAIMVCGGQRIYEETLPLADRLLLTEVHAAVAGDVWFPEWRHLAWRETWRREGADANYRYTFRSLDRVR